MLFKELINRAHQLESNPNCFIYYSALGTYQKDQNTEAQKTNILQAIKNQKVFHKIEFNYVDDNIIQNDYKKIGQKISRTFNFPKKILISTDEMKNVEDKLSDNKWITNFKSITCFERVFGWCYVCTPQINNYA